MFAVAVCACILSFWAGAAVSAIIASRLHSKQCNQSVELLRQVGKLENDLRAQFAKHSALRDNLFNVLDAD